MGQGLIKPTVSHTVRLAILKFYRCDVSESKSNGGIVARSVGVNQFSVIFPSCFNRDVFHRFFLATCFFQVSIELFLTVMSIP